MKEKIRLALCQVSSVFTESDDQDPRPANLAKAEECIAKAGKTGADLAIFGEVFLTGYRSDNLLSRYACSLDPPDEYIRSIAEIAAKNKIHIIMGLATRGSHVPGAVYNTAAFFGPQGLWGAYRKVYLANFAYAKGVAYESVFYARGRELPVFHTDLGSIAIEICSDLRHSEILRVYALKGAQMVVNIAAAAQGFEDYWDLAMRLGAMDNNFYFIMTSVVGQQKDDTFFGGSRVVDPYGQEIARIENSVEEVLVVELDLSAVQEAREASHIFFERMPELYEIISKPIPYP
jgi:predicted amidohydrolase